MSKSVTFLVVIVFVLVSLNAYAEVITADPNVPRPAVEEPAEPAPAPVVDERLAQNITYTSTDKRLGTVLAELTAMSGVSIRCGKNKDDWQVQDIPVVVCARDIELGKLLQSIAESAHLVLTPTTVNGVVLYRMWRTSGIEKMITDYRADLASFGKERVSRDLDFWQKAGTMPDNEWQEATNRPDESDAQLSSMGIDIGLRNSSARSFARLMAAAGPDLTQRVLSGERVIWAARDMPKPLADQITAIVRNYYLHMRGQQEKYAREHPELEVSYPEFKQEDADNARIEVWMSGDGFGNLASRLITTTSSSSPAAYYPASLAKERMSDKSLQAKNPDRPKTEYSPNLKIVQPFSSDVPAVLQAKIRIEKPKDKTELKFRDLLALFSEASGYSVVCEDFKSHDMYCPINRSVDIFDREITINDVLRKLTSAMDWYLDEEGKLIVASSYHWYDDHESLAPESLVRYIDDKLNGDGVYLEDMLPLYQLSRKQYNAWFVNSYGIRFPRNMDQSFLSATRPNPFWTFVSVLSSQDMALAKSQEGLPLGKFDPQYMSSLFVDAAQAQQESPFGGEERAETYETMRQVDVLPRLVMRLLREDTGRNYTVIEANTGGGFSSNTETGPMGIPRHRWRIILTGPEVRDDTAGLSTTFPIYSPKREAEIVAENRKSAAADSAKTPSSGM